MNKQRLRILRRMLLILQLCPISLVAAQPMSPEEKSQLIHEQWQKYKQCVSNTSSVDSEPPVSISAQEPIAPLSLEKGESKIPAVQEQEKALPEEYNKKITLKAKNIAMKDVMVIIADTLGKNIIYDGKVDNSKTVSINAENVEVWRALNTILYPLSYGFRDMDKDLVVIAMETRSFRVNLPPVLQNADDVTSNESYSVASDAGENNALSQDIKIGTKILVESKAEKLFLWDEFAENLKKLNSPNGTYMLNKIAGMVTVTDVPTVMDRIESYIKLVNRNVSQQVTVDVKVAEVSLTDEMSFGVDWDVVIKNLGSAKSISLSSDFAAKNFGAGPMMTLTIAGKSVKAVLKALDKQGKVEIVSQPRVTLLNNQVSVLQVGTTTTYIDESKKETTESGSIITSYSTSQVHEGVTMRLTANIVGEDIYLSVTPVVSTVDEIREIKPDKDTVVEAPKTTTKSMNTLVKVKNGETIVMGGLITKRKENKDEGIPVLNKLPVLRYFFGYKGRKDNRTELVIFITPQKIL